MGIRIANISITKLSNPNQVAVGEMVGFNIDITNHGPSIATGLVVTDTLPDGFSFQGLGSSQGGFNFDPATNIATFDIGSLFVGESAGMEVLATAMTPGSFTNTASVTGNEIGTIQTSNTVTTNVSRADLEVAKFPITDATANEPLSFAVVIFNGGPFDATGVTLTDTMEGAFNFVSAIPSQGTASVAGNIVTVNFGTVPVGKAVQLTLTVTPLVQGSDIVNTATVTSTTFDPNLSNNTISVITPVN